jgi:hypothetical protein
MKSSRASARLEQKAPYKQREWAKKRGMHRPDGEVRGTTYENIVIGQESYGKARPVEYDCEATKAEPGFHWKCTRR